MTSLSSEVGRVAALVAVYERQGVGLADDTQGAREPVHASDLVMYSVMCSDGNGNSNSNGEMQYASGLAKGSGCIDAGFFSTGAPDGCRGAR